MTDDDLLKKKLARIETCLRELRTLARPALLGVDVREERFIEHTLQMAIQAALDVASPLVSDERLGEPASNHELFSPLGAPPVSRSHIAVAHGGTAGATQR